MATKHADIRFKWLEERGYNVLQDRHQYDYIRSLWTPPDIVQAVFCEAKAGTGKTTLAVLAGVYEVDKGTLYDRLIYVRNAIPVRDGGFLPGDVSQKDAPYMEPLIEAMERARPGLYDKWSRPDTLNRVPQRVFARTTSYTRGLTWDRAFVIIDEAQSFDLDELQTIYTRCTDACKIVTIGSLRQNDNKRQKRYGGLTPFELYVKHFDGRRIAVHTLERNYRGDFANHADDVQLTVDALTAK